VLLRLDSPREKRGKKRKKREKRKQDNLLLKREGFFVRPKLERQN